MRPICAVDDALVSGVQPGFSRGAGAVGGGDSSIPGERPAPDRFEPSPMADKPLILRFLSVHRRMLGGEARGFPSDTRKNTRFVSLWLTPSEDQ
jgi:hypothetical protein